MTNEPINPGEGWRILKHGERRRSPDDQKACPEGIWMPVIPKMHNIEVAGDIIRRRIERTREQKDEEAQQAAFRSHDLPDKEIGLVSCWHRQGWFAALAYARNGEGK